MTWSSSQDTAIAAQRKGTGFWLERQGSDIVRITVFTILLLFIIYSHFLIKQQY